MSCPPYSVFLSIFCGVLFLVVNVLRPLKLLLMNVNRLELLGPPYVHDISGSVAEWSKALALGTNLYGGVGSKPTAAKFPFSIMRSLIKYTIRYCNFFVNKCTLVLRLSQLD